MTRTSDSQEATGLNAERRLRQTPHSNRNTSVDWNVCNPHSQQGSQALVPNPIYIVW